MNGIDRGMNRVAVLEQPGDASRSLVCRRPRHGVRRLSGCEAPKSDPPGAHAARPRRPATTISTRESSPAPALAGEDVPLPVFHEFGIGIVLMVVAKQMEDPVGDHQGDLVVDSPSRIDRPVGERSRGR